MAVFLKRGLLIRSKGTDDEKLLSRWETLFWRSVVGEVIIGRCSNWNRLDLMTWLEAWAFTLPKNGEDTRPRRLFRVFPGARARKGRYSLWCKRAPQGADAQGRELRVCSVAFRHYIVYPFLCVTRWDLLKWRMRQSGMVVFNFQSCFRSRPCQF